jgi:hypothetical protein
MGEETPRVSAHNVPFATWACVCILWQYEPACLRGRFCVCCDNVVDSAWSTCGVERKFRRWWRDQDAATQAATRGLVSKGQIEFVNGGWCMADDASPSMDAQIDQVTLGHR